MRSRILALGAFAGLLLLSRGSTERASVLALRTDQTLVRELPIAIPTPVPYPRIATASAPPPLTARSAAVVDVTSAVVLFAHEAQMRVKPASTTKIMTALIALEQCPLDKIVQVRTLDADDTSTQMGLYSGERITVESLLFGLLLNSGNDAALALTENCSETPQQFVERMNQKAAELHLQNTHFVNPSGIDHPDHYTTAEDLARLAGQALRHPDFARIVATKEVVVSNIEKTRWHTLTNKNLLLGSVPGVIGVKTGWTEGAGECLVAAFDHKGNIVVSVVLGSADRFGESRKLLEWTLSSYSWEAVSS